MKGERLHSHAPTQAARGELHFNELLILVCAPVIIIDLMNIYVPCLKLRDMRERKGKYFRNPIFFFLHRNGSHPLQSLSDLYKLSQHR